MLNPEELLSGSVSGAMSTNLAPIPEGEFAAVITDVAMRDFVYKKAGPLQGQVGYALDVTWEINDEQLRQQLKRSPTLRQSMILDLNGDALDLSEGRNTALGKLRKAVNQNEAGRPWSPIMLKGAVGIIQTKQRMDGDTIYTDVSRVTAA